MIDLNWLVIGVLSLVIGLSSLSAALASRWRTRMMIEMMNDLLRAMRDNDGEDETQ